jgi:hypothetical protein
MPKTPIDYSKAIIYSIVCKTDETLIYIGSTTNFRERKNTHRRTCNNENHNTPVYVMIRANGGWDSFEMRPIKEYNCDNKIQLVIEEERIRKEMNANLNTYRAYSTPEEHKEQKKKYNQENSAKIADDKKKYNQENSAKIADDKKKYNQENSAKIADDKKIYYEANAETIVEYQKKYREANRAKIAEDKKKYGEANKAKIAETGKKYYEANKAKIAENKKKYREANKAKINERRKIKRQELKNAL